jgi:cytosolic iron-sulfur protein assembly protein CIAO1
MPSTTPAAAITPLAPLSPDLTERAWSSIPHPTLPLVATTHGKSVSLFSLVTGTLHSRIDASSQHEKSIRTVAWHPGALPSGELALATGSFDATGGLWRYSQAGEEEDEEDGLNSDLEMDVARKMRGETPEKEWNMVVIFDGQDAEVKSVAFSPSGQYLATASRDKSVWIWEDVPDGDEPDQWETVAVLNEHEGDVKTVAWCPDVPGRNARRAFGADVLASASYDETVRIWREDSDGDWVCVAVLEGHKHTVWGVTWEGKPRERDRFPRLATNSADGTVRIWALAEDGEDAAPQGMVPGVRGGLGGVPNTMRRSIKEDWRFEAELPKVHDGDVYSVTWSAKTGLMASAGGDGVIALYQEESEEAARDTTAADGEAEQPDELPASKSWKLLATVRNAHGPYEINHIAWCTRFKSAAEKNGDEEMLVSTGDDGLIRTWAVSVSC